MELVDYMRLVRKWLWLFVIAALVAGGVAYVISSSRPEVYQAQTMLSVGSFIQSPNPDAYDFIAGENLAENYAVLATTFEVLQATIEAGGFPLDPEDLAGMVGTRIIPNTSMLVLSVEYTDPVLAADIANELARQLIRNSPTNLTAAQQSQLDLANAEIEKLNLQLQDTRTQLQLLDAQFAVAQTEAERADLQARRDSLLAQINQTSSNLAVFSATVASLQERTNSLDIVERARIPSAPGGLSTTLITLVGSVLGVGLAWVAVLIMEYLDDTVRTPEQVTQAIGLPVLGTIARFGGKNDDYPERLITVVDTTSPFAEGYRALRTNLLFSTEPGKKQAYIVTSVGPQEGKSVTAANLAVVMAMAGLRVLLVDADLRRPKVHHIFQLPNRTGLTTLLAANPLEGDGMLDDAFPAGDQSVECLQSTGVTGLRVITSGFLPSNPTEVLGSMLMRRWFKAFVSANNVDVVIFDVPPVLVVSDAMALAAATGAEVLLVAEAGRARRRDVLQAKDQFAKINVAVKGVVLNQISARDSGYGYGYYYYYSADTASQADGKQPKLPDAPRPIPRQ